MAYQPAQAIFPAELDQLAVTALADHQDQTHNLLRRALGLPTVGGYIWDGHDLHAACEACGHLPLLQAPPPGAPGGRRRPQPGRAAERLAHRGCARGGHRPAPPGQTGGGLRAPPGPALPAHPARRPRRVRRGSATAEPARGSITRGSGGACRNGPGARSSARVGCICSADAGLCLGVPDLPDSVGPTNPPPECEVIHNAVPAELATFWSPAGSANDHFQLICAIITVACRPGVLAGGNDEGRWLRRDATGLRRPSGRQDLNLRPLDPQSSALPSCATSRPPP